MADDKNLLRRLIGTPLPASLLVGANVSPFAFAVVEAMRAGLDGKNMPRIAAGALAPELLQVLNVVYEEARNRNAGERVRQKTR